jgi:transposase-like protein
LSAYGERSEERFGHRHGYRTRTRTTQVSNIALQIPVDRTSSAQP